MNFFLQSNITSSFTFSYVTCKIINEAISALENKNSTGHDNLSLKFIKLISQSILYPLSIIINQSLFTGIFPKDLKIAKVIPIYKKDDEQIFDNYRPISLLPAISKIFEKIVSKQIINYFTTNNLIFSSQHGFRQNHSTETAAIELIDQLKLEIDKGHLPISIFMDLSKAFDTIDHNILLKKLKFYGLDIISFEWFKSYLTNRQQYVIVNSENSQMKPVTTGVPQGSILGPLLFLIYINDISYCSDKFTFLCFADDTTITISLCIKNSKCKYCNSNHVMDENSINNELNKLYNWLTINKLSLNTKKTKYMVFHNPQRRLNSSNTCSFLTSNPSKIKINNVSIERVQTHIFLGITFHENLSWKDHTNKISNKVSKTIGIIRRIKSVVPSKILKTIYNSLFTPYLQYGILIWGFELNRLEILQKKCIRLITNSFPLAHTETLFKSLNILKISDIFKHKCLITYYKFKNKSLPQYVQNIFSEFTPINNYSLRSNTNKIMNESFCNQKNTEKCL